MRKKWLESLAFMSVFLLLLVGVRFALAKVERTPHVYDYAETLNLEERDDVVPEQQAETQEKDEEEESDTPQETPNPEEMEEPEEPEKPEQENPDGDSEPEQPEDSMEQPPAEDAPVTSASPQDSSQQEGPGAAEDGTNGAQEGDGSAGEGGGTGEGGPSVTPDPTLPPILAPSATPQPSATPIPVSTHAPTEPPEVTLAPTPVPDEIVAITCEWPDKDKPIFGEKISKSTMKVYTVYRSGKKEEVPLKDCDFIGLNNKVCGIRQFTVIYGDFDYTMNYTVNNYVVGLGYDWPNKEGSNCFRKGTEINGNVIDVWKNMADGTTEELLYGQYLMEGIDNKLVDVLQTFTISYDGFQVRGTCIFTEQIWKTEMNYYTDNTYTTLEGTVEGELDPREDRSAPSLLGDIVEWSGKKYRVIKQVLRVDGVVRPIGTTLDEYRTMKVHVTYECACLD
nr:hypothetical protein [Eubacterium sp.]